LYQSIVFPDAGALEVSVVVASPQTFRFPEFVGEDGKGTTETVVLAELEQPKVFVA
jgi:hypothetical protein